jgi:hypothetical protein
MVTCARFSAGVRPRLACRVVHYAQATSAGGESETSMICAPKGVSKKELKWAWLYRASAQNTLSSRRDRPAFLELSVSR